MADTIPSDGVRILRPSLDDAEGGDTVLRGALSLDTLSLLRTDYYQRERLSERMNRQIQRALDSKSQLPDITLGMRGDRFRVDADQAVVLLDLVFIIDGQQRVETIKAHLARFPMDKIRLGAIVYFNTNERRERARFHALNLYSTRVSPSVILRNSVQDIPMLASLYGLSMTDQNFAMMRRVSWRQTIAKDELITAMGYVKYAMQLHRHLASTSRSSAEELPQALANLTRAAGIQQVRENIASLWEMIDYAWGLRNLESRAGVPYLKGGFLTALVRVLSDHTNFWQGPKLVITLEYRKRFKSFRVQNPEVVRLASGHGAARDMLRLLLIAHLDARMRNKLVPRDPPPEAADIESLEDEAA